MLKQTKFKLLSVGANLLAIGAAPGVTQGAVAQDVNHSSSGDLVSVLNKSSLKSIGSAWLKMPPTCKAKNFFSEPVVVAVTPHSQRVQALFDAFDEAAA